MNFEAETLGEFYEEWTKYEATYKLGKEVEYGSVACFDLDDYIYKFEYSESTSSSSTQHLVNFGNLPTISQHRITDVLRVSFISVGGLQFIRCY